MSRRGESVGVVVTERSRVIVVSRDRNCFARAQKACGTNGRKEGGDVFHNISFVDPGSCKKHDRREAGSPIGPWSHARRPQERVDRNGSLRAASAFMKKTKSRSASRLVPDSVEQARRRVTTAEGSVASAAAESRVAKQKRKEAKVAARRAKKRLRRAKDELAEARRALAVFEEKEVLEAERRRTLARVRRPAARPAVKPRTSRRTKEVAVEPAQPVEAAISEAPAPVETPPAEPVAAPEVASLPMIPQAPMESQFTIEQSPASRPPHSAEQ